MNNPEHDESPIIGSDIPWKMIEELDCKVKRFTPFADVEAGKVKSPSVLLPYASLAVELPKLSEPSELPRQASMPVVHKVDFLHLWEVFQVRGVKSTEEVIVFYKPSRFLSAIKPKLHIHIYPKGFQEKMHDPNPQSYESRWFIPIAKWVP